MEDDQVVEHHLYGDRQICDLTKEHMACICVDKISLSISACELIVFVIGLVVLLCAKRKDKMTFTNTSYVVAISFITGIVIHLLQGIAIYMMPN